MLLNFIRYLNINILQKTTHTFQETFDKLFEISNFDSSILIVLFAWCKACANSSL
jgi:hypothetical protein